MLLLPFARNEGGDAFGEDILEKKKARSVYVSSVTLVQREAV